MRQITDEQGRTWEVVAEKAVVAHRKEGARLGFRPADDPTAPVILTPVEFNSDAAAEFAINTMSEKELQRRLRWALTDAGVA
jgi:hypothetical protein